MLHIESQVLGSASPLVKAAEHARLGRIYCVREVRAGSSAGYPVSLQSVFPKRYFVFKLLSEQSNNPRASWCNCRFLLDQLSTPETVIASLSFLWSGKSSHVSISPCYRTYFSNGGNLLLLGEFPSDFPSRILHFCLHARVGLPCGGFPNFGFLDHKLHIIV